MKPLKILVLSLLVVAFTACSSDDDNSPQLTITQTLAADADFSILVEALQATSLDETLDNTDASYTLFAPDNDAFIAAGYANATALIDAVGEDIAANILLYHVLGAEVRASQVETGFTATLGVREAGESLSMYLNASADVRINDAADVTDADIQASNGVIHKIDAVLSTLNIVELISLSPDHTALVTAINTAMLTNDFEENEPITVFAPIDEAFDDDSEYLEGLNVGERISLLQYHVIDAQNLRAAAFVNMNYQTFESGDVTIATEGGITITDTQMEVANVTTADIQGTNGVVHVIDKVLKPALP